MEKVASGGRKPIIIEVKQTRWINVFDAQPPLHYMSNYEEHDQLHAIHKYSASYTLQILMLSAVLVEHWLKYLRHTFGLNLLSVLECCRK